MAESITTTGSVVSIRWDTTTGQDLLKDGIIRNIFDTTAEKTEQFYKPLVNEKTVKDYWVRDQRMARLEEAVPVADGENIPVFAPVLGGYKTYTQRAWGAGVRMTFLMKKFNRIDLWEKMVADLSRIQKVAKDVEVHTMFNSPTSTTLAVGTGFDQLALASASHTGLLLGTTSDNYSNYVNAAMSVAAIEDMRYYFRTMKNDNGTYMGAVLDTIAYEPTLHPIAKQITGSSYVPFEESNTVNVIPDWKLKLYEDPMLTSTTMWFGLAKKNSKYDINVLTAMEPDLLLMDAPDTTRDRLATSFQIFTAGWGDPRMYCLGRL